jgi:hypothetical protein
MMSAVSQFVEFAVDEMVAPSEEPDTGVADAGEMIRQVSATQCEVNLRSLIHVIDWSSHFGRHQPRTPTVTDRRSHQIGIASS